MVWEKSGTSAATSSPPECTSFMHHPEYSASAPGPRGDSLAPSGCREAAEICTVPDSDDKLPELKG